MNATYRRLSAALLLLFLALAGARPAAAQGVARFLNRPAATGSEQYPAPPDYARPADWACRPGHEGDCTSGLDAIVIGRDGHKTQRPFVAAADPAIDCFYVYPTVSREPQSYADLTPGPAVMAAVRAQAGRLASKCRLFAPLYRQATVSHLLDRMGGDRAGGEWDGPYQDIVAAWTTYLAHDNQGRGVVLIGHSQGTVLLQRLIAEHIDGTPAQSRLVSAFLIGDPGLRVPKGQTVGGTFRHIPVCTAAAQTGCAYSWGSYLADDASTTRVFGTDKDGLVAACTNPAAPGGAGLLDSYFAGTNFAGAGSAPFVAIDGQIRAECRTDAGGSVLRITVLPGANADAIRAALDSAAIKRSPRDWGLHRADVALAQGSILHLLDAETAQWRRDHR